VNARLALVALMTLTAAACKLDSRLDYLGDKNPKRFGFGRTPSDSMIARENIDVLADGTGLPAGQGTPAQGAAVFAGACASCHGANGEGKPPAYPRLIGGPRGVYNFGDDPKLTKTIGNYWPYATTLYDYIRRAMPLTAPGSLSADQTYAVSAFLLNREGLLPDSATLDAKRLAAIRMPALSHYVQDDRRGSLGGKEVR